MAISHWLAVFAAPDISAVDKDMRFIGGNSHDFCSPRNIVLQTVIPGHHQSLGATERRHANFRGIIDNIIEKNPKDHKSIFWPRNNGKSFRL